MLARQRRRSVQAHFAVGAPQHREAVVALALERKGEGAAVQIQRPVEGAAGLFLLVHGILEVVAGLPAVLEKHVAVGEVPAQPQGGDELAVDRSGRRGSLVGQAGSAEHETAAHVDLGVRGAHVDVQRRRRAGQRAQFRAPAPGRNQDSVESRVHADRAVLVGGEDQSAAEHAVEVTHARADPVAGELEEAMLDVVLAQSLFRRLAGVDQDPGAETVQEVADVEPVLDDLAFGLGAVRVLELVHRRDPVRRRRRRDRGSDGGRAGVHRLDDLAPAAEQFLDLHAQGQLVSLLVAQMPVDLAAVVIQQRDERDLSADLHQARDVAGRIERNRQYEALGLQVRGDLGHAALRVDVHRQHRQLSRVFGGQFVQVGQLLQAGLAPQRPERDDHRAVGQLGVQVDGRAVGAVGLPVRDARRIGRGRVRAGDLREKSQDENRERPALEYPHRFHCGSFCFVNLRERPAAPRSGSGRSGGKRG